MKKVFTLCVAIMASAATFAQTTLWNGEDKELGKEAIGFWADGDPEVVANPETDGINTSEKCLKFVMTNDRKIVKLPFREWMTPSLQGSTRVSLMIKKSQAENIQIELSDPTDGSEGYWKKVASYYSEAGKWQKVIFDYTNNGSLYMTSLVFMPLGLPADHPFWKDAAEPWTSQKAWSGQPFPIDGHHSLRSE